MDISQFLPEIVAVIKTLIPVDRLTISDIDAEKEVLSLRCSWGGDDYYLVPGESHSLSGTMTEHVLTSDHAVIIETRLVDDVYAGGHPTGILGPNSDMPSWVAAPLRTRSSTIGVIHIRSKVAFAYQETEKRIVEMIASQLAGVLSAQTASERTRAEANERTALAEIGRVISSTAEPHAIYRRFAEILRTIVAADRIDIKLLEADRTSFQPEIIWENNGLAPGFRASLKVSGRPMEMIIRTKTSLLLSSATASELSNQFPAIKTVIASGVRSAVAVPLIAMDEVIGTIQINAATENVY